MNWDNGLTECLNCHDWEGHDYELHVRDGVDYDGTPCSLLLCPDCTRKHDKKARKARMKARKARKGQQ